MPKHFPLRDNPNLYDLETDVGERHDVEAEQPYAVKRLTKLAGDFDRKLQSIRRPDAIMPP